MKTLSLKDVCELITDGTHYTPPDIGKGFPFLTVKDVTPQGLDFRGCSFISPEDFSKAKIGNSAPKKGDVLFSKDGTVGKVHVVKDEPPFAVLSSIAILRPKKELDCSYFGHILRSSNTLDQAARRKTGSAIRRIILKDLSNVRIPFPPIEEQRRIAAILDKADAIRRKRKEAIRLTESLLRSAFLDMFGDPVTNPKGWDDFQFGELLDGIDSGWSPKCNPEPASNEEWGVLKSGAVSYGHFDDTEHKSMLEDSSPKTELEVKPGDLLFSRKNTYDLVGASAYIYKVRTRLLLPDLLFRFRLKETVDPVFLWRFLSHTNIRKKLSALASGSSGSMPNISKARLKQLKVFLPSIDQQKHFRHFVDGVLSQKQKSMNNCNELDVLFSSLLQNAFRGEL